MYKATPLASRKIPDLTRNPNRCGSAASNQATVFPVNSFPIGCGVRNFRQLPMSVLKVQIVRPDGILASKFPRDTHGQALAVSFQHFFRIRKTGHMVRVIGAEEEVILPVDRRGQGSRAVVLDAEVNVLADILARVALDNVALGIVSALAAKSVVEPLDHRPDPTGIKFRANHSQLRITIKYPGEYEVADERDRRERTVHVDDFGAHIAFARSFHFLAFLALACAGMDR